MPNTLYSDLSLTDFPDSIDSFTTYLDILASDGILIKQYMDAMNSGDIATANQILEQIPAASQKIIKATDLNKLTQAILSVERFYKTDLQPYVEDKQKEWLAVLSQFDYIGEWSAGTSYVKNNFVTYTFGGLTLLYVATGNIIPAGTPPTDTNYWRVLTIQGQQGVSGKGLAYRQVWKQIEFYRPNEAVTYDGILWMALQPSTGVVPGTDNSIWKKVMQLDIATYPIQETPPMNQKQGDLWFNTQANPTKYYYLTPLDNPATAPQIVYGHEAYDDQGRKITGTLECVFANPNLLDNWYFVGGGSQQGGWQFPVNQRGRTRYDGPGYSIDRWGSSTTSYIEITKDGIHIASEGSDLGYGLFRQRNIGLPWIVGQRVTLSVISQNNLFAKSGNISNSPDAWNLELENGYVRAYVEASSQQIIVEFVAKPNTSGVIVQAVKLELGSQQTLAHLENGKWVLNEIPDYGEQLRKCQEYYWESDGWFSITENDYITTSGKSKFIKANIRFPVSMNRIPTATILSVDKKTPGILSDWQSSIDTEIQAAVNPVSVFQSGFESIYSPNWVNGNYTFRVIANAEL